eukprot:Awhi_evm1s13410
MYNQEELLRDIVTGNARCNVMVPLSDLGRDMSLASNMFSLDRDQNRKIRQ